MQNPNFILRFIHRRKKGDFLKDVIPDLPVLKTTLKKVTKN